MNKCKLPKSGSCPNYTDRNLFRCIDTNQYPYPAACYRYIKNCEHRKRECRLYRAYLRDRDEPVFNTFGFSMKEQYEKEIERGKK